MTRRAVRTLRNAMTLGVAVLASHAAGWLLGSLPVPRSALAQDAASDPRRFRYDEASGRCRNADGREGYNAGSRESLTKSGDGECTDFRGSINLTYLRLQRANLRGANLEGASFYLGSITDSDLTGADLSGTHGQMEYTGSWLRRALLTGADLTWSDLVGADLDGADLRDARYSPHTRMPFDEAEARRRGMIYVPRP
jgi:hypothetical protein